MVKSSLIAAACSGVSSAAALTENAAKASSAARGVLKLIKISFALQTVRTGIKEVNENVADSSEILLNGVIRLRHFHMVTFLANFIRCL